jgi:preprotein translocase subunit SecD
MNNMKYRGLLLLCLLLLSSMACVTFTAAFRPAAEIILAPQESTNWDAKTLEQASSVIDARLKESLVGRYEVKVVGDSQISVALYNKDDVETAKKLATEIGSILFIDSAKSYPEDSKLSETGKIILSQKEIKTTNVIPNQIDSGYMVAFSLTDDGTQKFLEYTAYNIGHYLLIVRDDVVIVSPRVNSAISDGKGVIYGKFTQQDAKELASILSAQPLPISLTIIDVKTP